MAALPAHAGRFSSALSIGILRKRLPVAAKMVLGIEGMIREV